MPSADEMFDRAMERLNHDPFNIGASEASEGWLGRLKGGVLPKVAGHVVKSFLDAVTLPGDVVQGRFNTAPSEPGMWSDEDEARAQLNDREALNRTADLAGAVMGGSYAMPAQSNAVGAGIRAYHGSPHDFDRFDISKIGTGEGAQVYGHGLYFAENEAVARAYRDALAARNNRRPATVTGTGTPFDGVQILEADPSRPGRMYEVNIDANPEQFLPWDETLAYGGKVHQPELLEKVRAITPATKRPILERQVLSGLTGENVYKDILGADVRANTRAITGAMNEVGIPGIKYLDQGSRSAGEGSRNYVVFDDKLIDIIRKYGLAPGGFLGAYAASSGDAQAAPEFGTRMQQELEAVLAQ